MFLDKTFITDIIRKLSAVFLDLILPIECLGCGTSKTWLCNSCFKSISIDKSFPCIVCRRPSWQGETHKECKQETNIDGLVVASRRSLLLKNLIHSFKYENLKTLAPLLGILLNKKFQNSPLLESLLLNKQTLLIPVPLNKTREWDRGYNQSILLAEELIKTWPVNLQLDIVERIKNTKTQTDLPRHKRLINIKGAFNVADNQKLKNKRVILLDDVLTTGATLEEIAKQLKKAKVKEVWVIALMRD